MPPEMEEIGRKLDCVLNQINGLGVDVAVLKSHQTDSVNANTDRHGEIVRRIDALVDQGRIRNGRLEKLEDGVHGLKTWRGWATGVVLGGGSLVVVFAKLVWEHITK